MDAARRRPPHPHLRDEEALLVENAVRLAVDSVLNVLYGVHGARSREYQRMVADRDREIRRLERRLREIEQELQGLRRREPDRGDAEASVSLGPFGRPPSHVSSHGRETGPPSSPGRTRPDRTCASRSSETSGLSEAAGNPPPSPGGLAVKEEPCDGDAVFIKWEMSEDRCGECEECEEGPAATETQEDAETRKSWGNPQADPGGPRITEGEPLRNKKKSVPMSELPEEAQRLKRAAWRAASRRYYARKIARQQGNPSCPSPSPHVSASQPVSLVEKRRRTLISHLPEDSQTLQREAWRAASRRYYARKIARHQAQPAPLYGHLVHDVEPPGGRRGPDRAGSHGSSGGILCS